MPFDPQRDLVPVTNVAGIDVLHVPYKGEAPPYTDLIGDRTQFTIGNFAATSALLAPDSLRALAVTGRQRAEQLPDIPTVAESGLPGFENSGWFGLMAPADFAKNIRNQFNDWAVVVKNRKLAAK